MSTDLRHRLGRRGEQLAAEHFERLGFAIVARNHRTRYGEIDLIACDGRTLVFCEVKTRRGSGFGGGWEAVTARKQHKLRALGQTFLLTHRLNPGAVRFDVASVLLAPGRSVQVEVFEDAF
jgi:putative endonuclease